MTRRSTIGLGVAAWMLTACLGSSSAPSGGEAVRETHIAKTCTQTECQASLQSCENRRSEVCGSCLDLSCVNACANVDCGFCSGPSPCRVWVFGVGLASTRDQALYDACRGMVDHATECGHSVDGDPCEVFSRTERHAMIEAYQCVAATACDGDMSACGPAPDEAALVPLEAHAQEVCEAPLAADWHTWAAIALSWMRRDAAGAIETCLAQETCDEYTACLNAWTRAVDGSTPPSE